MSIGRHICKLADYAPALPTPFDQNDAIDAAAFEHFCEFQITALVVAGTTGEAENLTREEHCKLVRIAIGVSRGLVPVIAGTGSNSTQHAIELTKDAEASGADAILSIYFAATHFVRNWPIATDGILVANRRFRSITDMAGGAAGRTRTRMTHMRHRMMCAPAAHHTLRRETKLRFMV